jgi:hypothetical protein
MARFFAPKFGKELIMLGTKPAVLSERKQTNTGFNVRKLLLLSFRTNRVLTLLGVMMLVSMVGSLIGLLFDTRTLLGVPIWDKPIKFGISLALYAFTLIWLLSFLKGHPRVVGIVSTITCLAFFVEMIIIITQVIRGVSSHFNVATSFDSTLFSMMGIFIMLFWFANLVAAIYLLFQRFDNQALAWALRLALILALVGASLGILMTIQHTPEQQLAIATGHKLLASGGHSVGVNDGGAGLPFLGWSTVGGDLRVGHFVGLHALQIIPLLGWLILRFTGSGFSKAHQIMLVWVAGLGYAGLTALLTWQALRGQSIVAPDALTLGAFAALVATVGLLGGGVVLHARSQKERQTAAQDQNHNALNF